MNEAVATAIDMLLRLFVLEAFRAVMWGGMLLIVATWHAALFRWWRR